MKVLNPAFLGDLIKRYEADMRPYVSDFEDFENDLKSPTLPMFENYEKADFGALFLDCLVDKDCIGDKITSDDRYVYFKLDTEKIRDVTGIKNVEQYLFKNIYSPMFDEEHRKSDNELQYLEPEWDNGEEPEYYIRFDPVRYCETGITQSFRFVLYLDKKFFDYLEDESDFIWMKDCNYPYFDFARIQYDKFADWAVSRTKRYIRENLLYNVRGVYKSSALYGDTYFQRMYHEDIDKDYVVHDWLERIDNNEKIKWYSVYDNLIIATSG